LIKTQKNSQLFENKEALDNQVKERNRKKRDVTEEEMYDKNESEVKFFEDIEVNNNSKRERERNKIRRREKLQKKRDKK
jgi:hypothetical protein